MPKIAIARTVSTAVVTGSFQSGASQALDEYRRFRHIVRNVYTFNFRPDILEELVTDARPLFNQINDELSAFTQLIQEQISESE
ncbi:MAG: hypothetical protein AAF639_22425 [Chloroflexota bacterium]